MAFLGSERILAMFTALGLGTEAERQKYSALAKVGVVDVVKEEKPLVFLSDGGTADGSAEGQGNAELP
jgi:hypothetical protein